MRCIDRQLKVASGWALACAAVVATVVLAACSSGVRQGGAVGSGSAGGTGGADSTATPSAGAPATSGNAPPGSATTIGTTAAPLPTAGAVASMPAPGKARNWPEFQRMAARRLLAANPSATYIGVPPEPLLAIPVLEVELNGNGTVRRINVMRKPGQALDTIQLAVNAVHRAAPYGDVSHLPRPWKFTEVFLFDDNRRFKPRTLD